MLEDDICVTTQQVLVTNRPARNDSAGGSKLGNQLRQAGKGRGGEQTTTTQLSRPNPPQHLIRQTPPHDMRFVRFQMARAN